LMLIRLAILFVQKLDGISNSYNILKIKET